MRVLAVCLNLLSLAALILIGFAGSMADVSRSEQNRFAATAALLATIPVGNLCILARGIRGGWALVATIVLNGVMIVCGAYSWIYTLSQYGSADLLPLLLPFCVSAVSIAAVAMMHHRQTQ